jgi:glycosyltransferase involved in cell wall biosynthesis
MVSVLVPVRNEEQYIVGCIQSLLAQDYPQERFEIIVLDGASTDGTEGVIRQLESRTGRVRYVRNPGILASAALNVGLREAAGDLVVRMDAHGKAPTHYLSTVVRHMIEKHADHVGVKQRALGEGFWSECIARGISTPFGVGGSKHRCSRTDGWDEAGWSGGFWKARVLALGGFDESMGPNDDDEFFFRLMKAGGMTYRTAEVEIDYYCRKTLPHLWTQFYHYGLFKPRVIQKHRLAKIRHFVPALFVCACAVLGIATCFVSGTALWLAGLGAMYGSTSLYFAARQVPAMRYRIAVALPIIFLVLHFSYGTGFLMGIVHFMANDVRKRLKAVYAMVVRTDGLVE